MIPEFKTKDDLFKWLRENKSLMITQKKSVIKFADPLQMHDFDGTTDLYVPKSEGNTPDDIGSLIAKLAINTTNIIPNLYSII